MRKKGRSNGGGTAKLYWHGDLGRHGCLPFLSRLLRAMARAGAPGFPPHESSSLSVLAMSVEYLRQRGGGVWLGDGVGAEGQRPWAQLPANGSSREPQAVPRELQATTALFRF